MFARVHDYGDAIRSGSVALDKPLQPTTPVVVFCLAFYEQFFANVVGAAIGATTPDEAAKRRAAHLRLRQTGAGKARVRQLIAMYERLCELWDGALGFSYSNSPDEILEFNQRYVPGLLSAIAIWASEVAPPQPELAAASAAAVAAYNDALTK